MLKYIQSSFVKSTTYNELYFTFGIKNELKLI